MARRTGTHTVLRRSDGSCEFVVVVVERWWWSGGGVVGGVVVSDMVWEWSQAAGRSGRRRIAASK